MESKKRICLFAGYDGMGVIHDYVIYYIQQLSRLADVYYMADCDVSPEELEKLRPYVQGAYAQRHEKYDFGSWALLMEKIGWDRLESYDSLILCNDSCYGPLHPLEPIFEEMDRKELDFWGLTESQMLNRHLQSFFLVFNKSCLQSRALRAFFGNVNHQDDVQKVILNYEVTLAGYLENFGFRWASYVSYLGGQNPSLFSYTLPEGYHFPLLKVKNVVESDLPLYFERVRNYSLVRELLKNYPMKLIEEHVKSRGIALPWDNSSTVEEDEEILRKDRCLLTGSTNVRILVHLHLYYEEQLPYFIKKLRNLGHYSYDLYITLPEDKEFVRFQIETFFPKAKVIVVGNKGYDLAPFLKVLQQVHLSDYDYVLKLHTKGFYKTPVTISQQLYDQYHWRDILVDSLIGSEQVVDDCLRTFFTCHNVDMLAASPLVLSGQICLTKERLDRVYDLGNRILGRDVSGVDFKFVAGTMFLCRASILEPLKAYPFQESDFTPSTHTGGDEFVLAHKLERILGLLVYAAGKKIAGTHTFGIELPLDGNGLLGNAYEYRIRKIKRRTRRYKRTCIILTIICIILACWLLLN